MLGSSCEFCPRQRAEEKVPKEMRGGNQSWEKSPPHPRFSFSISISRAHDTKSCWCEWKCQQACPAPLPLWPWKWPWQLLRQAETAHGGPEAWKPWREQNKSQGSVRWPRPNRRLSQVLSFLFLHFLNSTGFYKRKSKALFARLIKRAQVVALFPSFSLRSLAPQSRLGWLK